MARGARAAAAEPAASGGEEAAARAARRLRRSARPPAAAAAAAAAADADAADTGADAGAAEAEDGEPNAAEADADDADADAGVPPARGAGVPALSAGGRRRAAVAAAAAAAGDDAAGGPLRRGRGKPPRRPSLLTDAAFVGDDGSDSSEEDIGRGRNTVGDVPPAWYAAEAHIGYDASGGKLLRAAGGVGDGVDAFLRGRDSSKAWRTLYDPVQDETYTLSKQEVALIQRLRAGTQPAGPGGEGEEDPYPRYLDWATLDGGRTGDFRHAFSAAPEPKRRFVPSAWEAKAVVRLVRALRRGWIKPAAERAAAAAAASAPPRPHLLWDAVAAEGEGGVAHTGAGLSRVAPPKPALPGHAESYNPPAEYLPSEQEAKALAERAEYTGRAVYVPRCYTRLLSVPAYPDTVQERFDRCLDLYLCPRVARQRLQIDPASLLPQLPRPRDLQPFPVATETLFSPPPPPHGGPRPGLRCVAVDPAGAWLATGDERGTLALWELATGRCAASLALAGADARDGGGDGDGDGDAPGGGTKAARRAAAAAAAREQPPVRWVAWCPRPRGGALLAAACGTAVHLVDVAALLGLRLQPQAGAAAGEEPAHALSLAPWWSAAPAAPRPRPAVPSDGPPCVWWRRPAAAEGGAPGAELGLRLAPTHLAWHPSGDHLASVSPAGGAGAVVVHQVSTGSSQPLFSKNRGRVCASVFHPAGKALLFVATQRHVYVYNLAKQALVKSLQAGCGPLTGLALHPKGDNLVVSSGDGRVAWFDLDLSARPYKTFRSYGSGAAGVAFHRTLPLFASAGDDATAHVWHGRVYEDLATNALLVPLVVLRGHAGVAHAGVRALAWHPTQPWLVTAGADGTARLWVNV